MDKVNTLRIRTPEGITFSLLLAGPVSRFIAWLIDFGVVLLTSTVLSSVLMLLSVVSPDFGQALMIILMFALQFGYGIVAEWYWRGQTIGKKVLRLRVVDAEGLKLQPAQIIVRNLLRAVDSLPAFYILGGAATVLTKRSQRLGDLAANTIVIREPRLALPDVDQLLSGKFNSLRQHPHLEARLRQLVSAAEATLALQALVRRDELEPAARVEVFGQLANHIRSLVEFPPEAIEGIADEQYVRNVVDILFRPRAEKAAANGAKAAETAEIVQA
jgi:uncharacterized RDD family membrane protein YckC